MTSLVHDGLNYRIVALCQCGRAISLPDVGYSYEVCDCGRVWEHTWNKQDKRRLACHTAEKWAKLQHWRGEVDG